MSPSSVEEGLWVCWWCVDMHTLVGLLCSHCVHIRYSAGVRSVWKSCIMLPMALHDLYASKKSPTLPHWLFTTLLLNLPDSSQSLYHPNAAHTLKHPYIALLRLNNAPVHLQASPATVPCPFPLSQPPEHTRVAQLIRNVSIQCFCCPESLPWHCQWFQRSLTTVCAPWTQRIHLDKYLHVTTEMEPCK